MTETIVHITNKTITNKAAVRKLFALEDGKYLVSVKPYKKRSTNQNDYYWGVVLQFVLKGLQDAGWQYRNVDQVHEKMKEYFLNEEVLNTKTGEVETIKGTTTKLSTTEFIEFTDRIKQFAAEYLNIVIPDPGHQILLAYGDTETNATIIQSI